MRSFRAHWSDDRDPVGTSAPTLRVVSRSAPPRPRWGSLYVAVSAVLLVGVAAAHWRIGLALVLVVELAAWVRVNRVALTRLDEPDVGTGMPSIRVIRSRSRSRLEREERVVLPYDFR